MQGSRKGHAIGCTNSGISNHDPKGTTHESFDSPCHRGRRLVKRFGAFTAVDGVSLTVPTGSVYGVLGPNGAGKTTTIRMLATLLRPDAGSARVFGHDVVAEPTAVRSLVGVTGQYASVDEDLTATENLMIFARLLGLSRTDSRRKTRELLEEFALEDAASKSLKYFSGGMRRRLDLAASLISQPPLLFLDEPTTGLDPRTRAQMWDTIRRLVAEGSTVLLTTQYLDEADQLADRIAVIDHGRVIADGTADELKRRSEFRRCTCPWSTAQTSKRPARSSPKHWGSRSPSAPRPPGSPRH